MAGEDLHVPSTDPNAAVVSRIAALEQRVADQGITLGIGGTEGIRQKLIRGRVAYNGGTSYTRATGSGWSVQRNSTGVLILTFDVQFSDYCIVVASPETSWSSGTAFYCVTETANATQQATVRIFNTGGTPAEQGFNFIAVGPA